MISERSVNPSVATSVELLRRLAERFPPMSHAIFKEVPVKGGRQCDVAIFSLWHSEAYEIQGFEVKCSRNDWLREIKDPSKASASMEIFDRWWLLCPKDVIESPDEVPSLWGIMHPHGDGLRIARRAPRLHKDHASSLDRAFLAGLFRRAAASSASNLEIMNARAEAIAANNENWQQRYDRLKSQMDNLGLQLKEFEKASGIRIDRDGYRLERIAKLVGMLLHMPSSAGMASQLERAAEITEAQAARLREAAAEMKNLPPLPLG